MTVNIEREFAEADRYLYDQLLYSKGYARIDSKEDASYYGNWASVKDRVIFSYAEGDCTTTTCDTAEEFATSIRRLAKWMKDHENWIGIDVSTKENAAEPWISAGLEDLLDGSY